MKQQTSKAPEINQGLTYLLSHCYPAAVAKVATDWLEQYFAP